jgi:hypothetical protein
MGYTENLESFVMRCVERALSSRYSQRHGQVTSYDPKTYRAKVRFMPSGQQSGWLPIETGHIGNGYGIAVGLNAGDGEKTGDQVVVRFSENDFEGGTIVQRVHSDVDKPPHVESGELCIYCQWGQQIRFDKDGKITIKTAVPTEQNQPSGNQVVDPTFTPQQPPTTQQPQQQSKKQQKPVTVTIDDQGNHTIDAKNNITQNASSQINDNAGQSWTSTAPKVNTVGETHLGSTGGQLLSMSGTLDTAGHADIPPVASKVYAS